MTTKPHFYRPDRIERTKAPRILESPYLLLVSRLLLAGIFLLAAFPKISDPALFAQDIRGYQILPFWGIHLAAITLPWIELVIALLLIVGIWTREAAMVAGGLLVVFVIAIVSTILRGIEVNCGCFGDAVQESTGWGVLFRDIGFLALTLHILFFDRGTFGVLRLLRRNHFSKFFPRFSHFTFLFLLLFFAAACSKNSENSEKGNENKFEQKTKTKEANSLQPGDHLPQNLIVRKLNVEEKKFEEHNLFELSGNKPILLFYWLPGYPICEEVLLDLQRFVDQPKFADLAVFAVVNIQEGKKGEKTEEMITPENVLQRVAQLGIKLPVLLDQNYFLGQILNVKTSPSMSVIDRDHVLKLADAQSLRHWIPPQQTFEDFLKKGMEKGSFELVKKLPPHYPVRERIGGSYLDFSLQTIDSGKTIQLKDAIGKRKLTLLSFWSVYCSHCQKSIPKLNEFYKKHHDQVEMISVVRVKDEEMRKATVKFIQEHGIQFPVLADEEQRVAYLYGIISTPTLLIMTPEGKIDTVLLSGDVDYEKVIGQKID